MPTNNLNLVVIYYLLPLIYFKLTLFTNFQIVFVIYRSNLFITGIIWVRKIKYWKM